MIGYYVQEKNQILNRSSGIYRIYLLKLQCCTILQPFASKFQLKSRVQKLESHACEKILRCKLEYGLNRVVCIGYTYRVDVQELQMFFFDKVYPFPTPTPKKRGQFNGPNIVISGRNPALIILFYVITLMKF